MKKLVIFALLLSVSTAAIAGGYSDKVKKIKSPKGTTLTGVVYCGDEPLAGVSVTDGREIVRTDKNGIYRIASTKPYGLVYISAPSGFAPTCEDGIMPQFWASTTTPAKKCERHDFELKKVDDKQFSIIFCSDSHFCNDSKRNDLHFFKTDHMAAVNKAFADAKEHPVYTVCLGDVTWDRFWFETGFDLPQVPKLLSECNYPTPVYAIMGNHDNDPSVPCGENTDFIAENKWRETFGPTFYSVNIGDTHFVMLDNIVYKNTPSKPNAKKYAGVVGTRNYDAYIVPSQLEWLKKDLASVDKSTPIVICMHAPLRLRDANGEIYRGLKKGEGEKLIDAVKDFDCVRIFSGHKHQSHFFEIDDRPNITETSVPSLAGELWSTGNRIGRNICDDGTEAGLLLCKFDGKTMTGKTFYGHRDGNMPMRLYDMNSVRCHYADSKDSAMLKHARELLPNQKDYSDAQYENYVYINCWACDAGTTIEASEDGKPLTIEQVKDCDPWAAIAIIAPGMKKRKKIEKRSNCVSLVDHMYRVKTESATTPVTVAVKTPFGETYTQTLERPAEFPNFIARSAATRQ